MASQKAKFFGVAVLGSLVALVTLLSLRGEQDPRLANEPRNEGAMDPTYKAAAPGVPSAPPNPSLGIQPRAEETGPLLDIFTIQEMLDRIPRDADGYLTYNGDTRKLLDQACDLIGPGRSKAEIEGLVQIVQESLPESDASAVTDTLKLYYEYKAAERDHLASSTAANPAEHYRALTSLRNSYLGHTLANQLFAEEDRFFQFNLQLMELNQRQDLTEQERTELQRELERSYGLSNVP